jgi:hypothetical protein
MKIVSRVLIVLMAFVLVAGLLIVFDSAASALAVSAGLIDGPRVERHEAEQNHEQEDNSRNENRPKPSIPYMIKRWVLNTGKNVFVLMVLVVLIVFPKSLAKRYRKMPR